MDTAPKTGRDALKTASKKVVYEAAESTGDHGPKDFMAQ